MKVFLLLVLVLAVVAQPVAANKKKIYVWRNAEGVLVFSDSPKPDVKADTIDVLTSPNIVESVDVSILKGDNKQVTEEKTSIAITKPLANETIRDNTGSVYIDGAVKPLFKRGMKVTLKLDGKQVAGPQKSAVFILHDIDRGEHQVQLELWDDLGKLIAVSKPTTFYLHRNRIKASN